MTVQASNAGLPLKARPASGGLVGRFLRRHRSVLIAAGLFAVLLWLVNSLSAGGLTYFDISYMAGGGATTALAAVGQTLVILTGGFDLSAGAVISLVNVTVASTMQDSAGSQIAITLLGIAIGGLVGAFNGVFVSFLRLQPIVVTLSTLFIVQGIALLVRATPGGEVPGDFMALLNGDAIPGILPAPIVILAIAIGVWLYIKNTRLGTAIYAIGSDPDAARAAGVRERLVKFVTYVIAGCFYGAAGVFVSAQTGGSDPLVGTPMLLQIFAAVVLGGTVLGGGRGGAIGSVIGAYLLMIFVNLLLIADVPAYYSTIVEGVILIVAVLAGSLALDTSVIANLRDVTRRLSASLTRRANDYPRRVAIQPDFDPARLQGNPTLRWIDRNRETLKYTLPVFIALVVVVLVTAIFSGGVGLRYANSVLVLATFLGVLALGQGTVILSGGLDLSVPWTIALCAILLTGLASGNNEAAVWAVPLAIVAGAAIGLCNGIGITVLGLPPIVMTLATNGILQGIALLYSQGTPAGFTPPALKWLTTGEFLGPTPIVWLFLVFIIFGTVLLGRTPLGRRIYAVGNNIRTAHLSGINVRRTVTSAYVLSGFCSAVVGVLLVGFNGQASLGMGDEYLLPSIAVVVVGGTLITGGRGHYLGMVGGALLLTALQTLLGGTTLPFAVRSIIFGLVVLGAIVLLRERRT